MKKTNKNSDKRYLKIKEQVTGITLIALVITIIILMILATVSINVVLGEGGLIDKAKQAKDLTEQAVLDEQEGLNSLVSEMTNIMAENQTPPGPTELPADGSFSEEKGVNTPNIIKSNMELVKFDEGTQDWIVDETNSAYSYKDTATEGTNTSEWANARVTIDEIDSYFVWIPRYAYKIIGKNNIDIKFIKGTGKETADGITCKYASENPTADDYIIHPAFTNEENNGGWNSQLPGIWIGKYEASLANKVDESNIVTDSSGTGDILLSDHPDKIIVTKPGYSSWRNISIGKMYNNAKYYSTKLNSHMLKNSEWGAVAYLTESTYGRNGNEVEINNNGTTCYTGGGTEKAYTRNTLQSTTGNVYGIYDLSGNAVEYVAAGYQNQSLIGTSSGSNEFGTVYTQSSASTGYKYGDATYETSGWHSDSENFVSSSSPFFGRGGGLC